MTMMVDPSNMNTQRDKAMKETFDVAKKERFGLFSYYPPLGMGDCVYEPHHHPRDENGGIAIEPRNFYSGIPHKGKSPEVYFDNSNFLNKEKYVEPYIDYPKIHKALKSNFGTTTVNKEGEVVKIEPFLNGITTKWMEYKSPGDKFIRLGNPYESMPDHPIPVKKNYKDEESGKVSIGPPNILVPCIRHGHYNSTIQHTINPFPKHTADVYDAGRHDEYKERKKWQDHYKESGKGYFKSMNAGPYLINKDRNVYGNRPPQDTRPRDGFKYKGVEHTDKFRPSNPYKKGKLGTIGPFQRLIPDPSAIHKAVRKPEPEDKPDPFKPSRNEQTRPTPSISLNMMNLRPMIKGK